MTINNQHIAYFSATKGTKTLVKSIAADLKFPVKKEYDITKKKNDEIIELEQSDLFVLGVPSYSGRVPMPSVESIKQFRGKNTPAIVLCSYGNRDYDDT